MDETMEQCWRSGAAPFDGVVVSFPVMRAEDLRALVLDMIPALSQGAASELLGTFVDWHEHDGYRTSTEEATWRILEEALADATSFIAASSDDTYVRRAWYPLDHRFLLRWCVSSDPDDFGMEPGPPAGQVDVTASPDLASRVAALVAGSEVAPAKEHFDRTWGG